MAGLNKVMLIGNLGKDPEVKTLENGAKIATFPLATSESYKDKEGNRQTRTEWHNLVLWRGLADIAQNYLHKGSQVFVEGRLSTRKWEDKDGHTRYTTEVIGDNLVLLNRAGEGGQPNSQMASSGFTGGFAAPGAVADDLLTDSADDLPF